MAGPALLDAHLRSWLGRWPPRSALEVVGYPARDRPGWDGRIHPVIGVRDPRVGTLLSVPPDLAAAAPRCRCTWPRPAACGVVVSSGRGVTERIVEAVFRWTERPAPLADAGDWLEPSTPGLPGWLRPFGSKVLVATAPDGRHLAAVGVKHHDVYGKELAVVTAPGADRRGLGRRLVAQAARAVLATGAISTYLHDRRNVASAHLADAAGFPDRGWTAFGLSDEDAARE